MNRRKIKIDNVVYDIDISDGKYLKSFSMNGAGQQKIYINGAYKGDGYIENKNCLDGNINFKELKQGCQEYKYLIDDKNYELLKYINALSYEMIKKIDIQQRINAILFGLKYENIDYFCRGYDFGNEFGTYFFCCCFSKEIIVFFASNHNGCMKPDFLSLNKNENYFDEIYNLIKIKIIKHFDLED